MNGRERTQRNIKMEEFNPQKALHVYKIPAEDADQLAFNRLPRAVRSDVEALLVAFEGVSEARKTNPALRQALGRLSLHRPLRFHTLRRKYYAYESSGDWRALVDWTRTPRRVRPNSAVSDKCALPADLVEHLKGLMTSNQRKSEPAIRALLKAWRRGDSIPGYGTWQEWFLAEHPHAPLPDHCPPELPRGWSKANLRRHIPDEADLALARLGVAAARRCLPDIMMTREELRPLEFVMFDDVRTDFRILVPGCDRPVDLNLLVALDVATGMILRYGIRPAIEREDGMKDKLKLQDMKCLVAGILLEYGIPREYTMELIVENATAAIRDGFALALAELARGLHSAITVHRTEMICGTALFAGYKDRATGNPGGKAALESTFNLFHNEAAFLPGQTGRRYDAGPCELAGRSQETVALARASRHLSPHERAALKMPFLNYSQARLVISDVWNRIIRRTDHVMEAFETIGEFRLADFEQWRPERELVQLNLQPGQVQWRNPARKESPFERWDRLVALAGGSASFIRVLPCQAARLYDEHKPVSIINGEIAFAYGKESYVYRIANAIGALADRQLVLKDRAKFLAYFDPQDLSFIHLTDGQGGYVATLPRTRGIRRTDTEALAAEFKRKRGELHALQERVSRRLPERIEERIADLDANTQILSGAMASDLGEAFETARAVTAAAAGHRLNPAAAEEDCTEELLARAAENAARLENEP